MSIQLILQPPKPLTLAWVPPSSSTPLPLPPRPSFGGITSRRSDRAVRFGLPSALAPPLATWSRREFFGLDHQRAHRHPERFGDDAEAAPPLIELATFDLLQFGRAISAFAASSSRSMPRRSRITVTA